jgi:hypothetical protein
MAEAHSRPNQEQVATFVLRVNLQSRLPAKFDRSGYSRNRRYGMQDAGGRLEVTLRVRRRVPVPPVE